MLFIFYQSNKAGDPLSDYLRTYGSAVKLTLGPYVLGNNEKMQLLFSTRSKFPHWLNLLAIFSSDPPIR